MRWPFAMRSTVELYKTLATDCAQIANRETLRADRADARYADLVQSMVGLKRDGFGVRDEAPQVAPPQPKLPPQILINAAREVSPIKDKTLEYNMELIYAREDAWGDEDECRKLADQIRNGAVRE
jgi:hypothetical protein